MNAITPYLFKDAVVRTINQGTNILFCAKDVCEALGLDNNRQAISALRDSEKITVTISDGNPRAGIPHEMTFVTEPGLYRLIFKSRKAEAQVFQDWVFHEVLPKIRKTGSYHRGHQAFLNLIADQIELGVSADLAARLAGKLTNIPKEEMPGYRSSPQIDQDIQNITSLMIPDTSYSVDEIAALLTDQPHLTAGSKDAQRSRIGKIMIKAVREGRVERIEGRNTKYRRPAGARGGMVCGTR
jgi:prophage antirepressor-like protein